MFRSRSFAYALAVAFIGAPLTFIFLGSLWNASIFADKNAYRPEPPPPSVQIIGSEDPMDERAVGGVLRSLDRFAGQDFFISAVSNGKREQLQVWLDALKSQSPGYQAAWVTRPDASKIPGVPTADLGRPGSDALLSVPVEAADGRPVAVLNAIMSGEALAGMRVAASKQQRSQAATVIEEKNRATASANRDIYLAIVLLLAFIVTNRAVRFAQEYWMEWLAPRRTPAASGTSFAIDGGSENEASEQPRFTVLTGGSEAPETAEDDRRLAA